MMDNATRTVPWPPDMYLVTYRGQPGAQDMQPSHPHHAACTCHLERAVSAYDTASPAIAQAMAMPLPATAAPVKRKMCVVVHTSADGRLTLAAW